VTLVTVDHGGRRLVPCGAEPALRPTKGWKLQRRPRCTRNAGHDGPHQERDPATFAIHWEWSE